ncbi:MAG: hypothetical protein ACI82I_001721 [Gammaproteobacteria bacterium]|jgi:hypothetical protein
MPPEREPSNRRVSRLLQITFLRDAPQVLARTARQTYHSPRLDEIPTEQCRKMKRTLIAALLCSAFAQQAPATVLDGRILRQNGMGEFVKLETDIPFDVGADNFDADDLYAFDEDQNITLDAPVHVDIGGDGGKIPAGATIASHYVFFDSINGIHYGHVDFDAPILGVAALPASMDATDFLANTSVNYISTDLRGLEPGDYVWVDEDDPFRLWVYWAGSSPGDYIRVFTALSPGAMM